MELTNTRHLTRLKITCIEDRYIKSYTLPTIIKKIQAEHLKGNIRKSAVIMGLFLSRLYSIFEAFSLETPARILMLGLDGAGKCCTKFIDAFLRTKKKLIRFFLIS